MAKPEKESGKFAYDGLDRIVHEKARLGILTCLLTRPEGLVFTDLKKLCSLTDGNLSRHLQILKEAGLINIWKGYENNRPQTLCRLTPAGRKRFLEYMAELEKVIKEVASAEEKKSVRAGHLSKGWAPA